jgi:hypothetical protein
VGDAIEADYAGQGRYYPGVINGVITGVIAGVVAGTSVQHQQPQQPLQMYYYSIKYDDGDTEEGVHEARY